MFRCTTFATANRNAQARALTPQSLPFRCTHFATANRNAAAGPELVGDGECWFRRTHFATANRNLSPLLDADGGGFRCTPFATANRNWRSQTATNWSPPVPLYALRDSE